MVWSVKENDLSFHGLSADWALCDLIGTELTRPMATQKDTIFAAIHAHLTLRLLGMYTYNTLMCVYYTWVQVAGDDPFVCVRECAMQVWVCVCVCVCACGEQPIHTYIPCPSSLAVAVVR